MGFQKKYWCEFRDVKEQLFRVEIWEDTGVVLVPVEVTGGAVPFVVDYPVIGNKFEPVRGSGCDMVFVSDWDRQFMGLYTAEIFQYQIRFYRPGGMCWCGYLDTELYREPFEMLKDYDVSLSGTDGMALLERILYLTDSDLVYEEGEYFGQWVEYGKLPYTGIVSQWEVIKNCLKKLGLPWNMVAVSISTTSEELVLAEGENIFEKTFCINENWYTEDENNNAENCRTVLEGILAPYGAFIQVDDGTVVITDVNAIAQGVDQQYMMYVGQTFVYMTTVGMGFELGDLTDIGFSRTGIPMGIVSAVNRQVVRYSPYKQGAVIDYSPVADFTETGATGPAKGAVNYQWTETEMGVSYAWEKSGNGRFVDLKGVMPQTDEDSYLSINTYGGGNGNSYYDVDPAKKSFRFKGRLPYLIPNGGYKLKVSMSAMFRTSDDYLKTDVVASAMAQGVLACRLRIGGKEGFNARWHQENKGTARNVGWRDEGENITTPEFSSNYHSAFYLFFNRLIGVDDTIFKNFKYSSIENQWVGLNNDRLDWLNQVVTRDFLFPLTGFTGDVMEFEVYDFFVVAQGDFPDSDGLKAQVKEVRIKDVKFTIVDKEGKEIPVEDTEYVAYMDSAFKNEGKEITLLQGTNVAKNPVERGSMMGFANGEYFFIQNWTRQGVTDCIENLLLRSIVSNYTAKTIELQCVPYRMDYVVGCLTYELYLAGLRFMVMGCRHDFKGRESAVTIQEVSVDDLFIKKSF